MSDRLPLTGAARTSPSYDAMVDGSAGVPQDDDASRGSIDLFMVMTGTLQLAYLVLFFVGTDYSDSAASHANLTNVFVYYIGIVIMMLIGFGYLMTFLWRAGLSAVGFTFIITMLCVQTDILAEGGFTNLYNNGSSDTIKLDLMSFVKGNFAAAACLISFGGIIGKCGMQVLAPLVVLESIFYAFNREVVQRWIGLEDIGGTVLIHMFGAYFGLAAAFCLGVPEEHDCEAEAANRTSDITSLIGTTFLWVFWPAFNGAGAPPNSAMQQRVVLNTIIALTFCTMWTFVLTRHFHKKKFGAVEVQNATLAGGVMVGVTSNYMMHPSGAALVGIIAATISVVGYNVVQPRINNTVLHDTCGINNLHGMPSIAGAIVSVIMAASAKKSDYSDADYAFAFPHGDTQWSSQMWGSLATFTLAIVSGYFSMLACKNLLQFNLSESFTDQKYWEHEYRDVGLKKDD